MSETPRTRFLQWTIALALYPLVLAIYFGSDVWMWIGYQWRTRIR
jgi:hypothetical protein